MYVELINWTQMKQSQKYAVIKVNVICFSKRFTLHTMLDYAIPV